MYPNDLGELRRIAYKIMKNKKADKESKTIETGRNEGVNLNDLLRERRPLLNIRFIYLSPYNCRTAIWCNEKRSESASLIIHFGQKLE